MIAFEENLIALLKSIEECLAKGQILPCLMLLYAGIDVVASLEAGRAGPRAFRRWVNKYLLKAASLSCTALDLYGARCGILHTFSAKSDMSAKGQAREIVYAWGNAKAADLAAASIALGRNDCVLHLRDLINAFRVGLADYLEEVMKDDKRKQKLEAGAGLWFTHLDQETVRTFLKAARIAE